MRAQVFKKIMELLEKHPSKVFARMQIQILLNATAKAFQRKGKCVLFSGDALKKYAEFSKDCMERQSSQRRLRRVSFKLGRRVRQITGFTDSGDLERLVFLLYRNIGITMEGSIPGRLIVSKCFFGGIYSAEHCRCISAMDEGIIAGICGDGTLSFTERITEGCGNCLADFITGKEK